MSCSDECSSDSDCSGDNKCCYNGCSYSCLKAVIDPGGLDEETKDDQVPIGKAEFSLRYLLTVRFSQFYGHFEIPNIKTGN